MRLRVNFLRYARLPTPAAIAAPPRTKTRPSCRPAVPPPPVAGAPVGKTVVAVGSGDGLTVVVAGLGVVVVVVAVAVGCVVVAVAVGEWIAVLVGEAVEVAVPVVVSVPDGEKIAGTLDDGAPVQAETVAETRTIKVAQLRRASRGLPAGLADVMRTFKASLNGREQVVLSRPQLQHRKRKALSGGTLPTSPEVSRRTATAILVSPCVPQGRNGVFSI